MSEAMGNPPLKPAKGYVTKSKRRRQANEALVDSSDVDESNGPTRQILGSMRSSVFP